MNGAAVPEPSRAGFQNIWRQAAVVLALLLIGTLVLFNRTAMAMVTIWWRSETFTHAFLVLPISLWLIWRLRSVILMQIPQPSTSSLLLLALVVFAWLLGDLAAVNAVTMFALLRTAGEAYDIRPISYQVKALETSNTPVAFIGKYAGTYDFVGRLSHPPEVLEASGVAAWLDAHADGRVIAFFDQKSKPEQAEFLQHYKGQFIAILTREQWLNLYSTAQQDADVP